jgi:hypothetical protein
VKYAWRLARAADPDTSEITAEAAASTAEDFGAGKSPVGLADTLESNLFVW